MSGAVQGIVASEWRIGNTSSPTFGDVVFQSTWSGTNGGTDAIDESNLHATLTFSGAQLVDARHLFDAATCLRCDALTDYVSAPANAAYDIGISDFTFETFINIPTFATTGAMQWMGVWRDDDSTAAEQWRVVSDSLRVYVQAKMGGIVRQWSFAHQMLTDTWYWFAFCRYAGLLRGFKGELGGLAKLQYSANMIGKFDALAGTPLYIGGNIGGSVTKNGANAFFQHMRLSRNSWYRTDDDIPVPNHKFNFGVLIPSYIPADDVFYPVVLGQVVPALFVDADIFASPTVKHSPSFVNASNTTSQTFVFLTSGGPVLPGSRANGNLLIAFIQAEGGGQTFSVSSGWTMGDTSVGASSSTAWAWRIVDGTEAAPVFSWGSNLHYHSRCYQFTGNHPTAPIGNKLNSLGASGNLIINSGVGVATTDVVSLAFALTLTSSNNQTLPVPTGYTAVATAYGDASGSDRASVQAQGASGSVSLPVNLTIASALWHGFLIEIKVP